MREPRRLGVRDIGPPGHYRDVVVVLAELCSFSSFVRDTPNAEVIRENLTSFYSRARYQIINSGGMLYQFVGDEVIGIFGLPDHAPGYVEGPNNRPAPCAASAAPWHMNGSVTLTVNSRQSTCTRVWRSAILVCSPCGRSAARTSVH